MSLVAICVLGFIVGSVGHCQEGQEEVERLYAKFGELSKDQKYEEAEKTGILLVTKGEEVFGKDHPSAGFFLNNLAGLYRSQGKYEEAEPLYERALKIREEQLGADHPDTAQLLNNLAALYLSQGKYEEAEPLFERAIDGIHNHHIRMLRYFPDRDCLAMQRALFTQNVAGNSLSGHVAAKEQIWFKGAVLNAMNNRRALEEELGRSETGREVLSSRKDLSRDYRREVLETGAKSERSRNLEQQLAELEKRMALLLKEDLRSVVGAEDLIAVQSVFPGESILVESFRYGHRLAAEEWEDRYSSGLISRAEKPVYVAHGKAEEIEDAITRYRKSIADENIENRSSQLREAEANLWETYLSPLEEHLEPGQSVIFSLDSQLHFVPLGMIRDAEGVPFGQKYKVRYVTSGRDLLKEVKRNSDGEKSALVLGNPSYRDNQPLRALADAAEEAEAQLVASNLRTGMSNDAGSITLTPLPGTAREIAELGGKLKDSGYTVTSLSQGGATEEALEQAINGHDIVHLATHGFFLSEIERKTKPEETMLGAGGLDQQVPVVISDPMYRSGLALAGAQSTFNLWKNGQVPPPSKDGILLAAEANLLNLRGTDLVVLSACETASGEALDGEGVMGLRRAFASAGANNTIMTLWPVNDAATVEVMDAFYEKYLSGTHPAIALAEVQNELYAPFVEKYGEVEAIARLAAFVCMSLGQIPANEKP